MLKVEIERAVRRNREMGAPVAVHVRLLERVDAALFPRTSDYTADELVAIRRASA